jgi:hypothetical protein
MDIKQLTQLPHIVAVMMLLDKGVSYSGGLQSTPRLFNKSHSSVTRGFDVMDNSFLTSLYNLKVPRKTVAIQFNQFRKQSFTVSYLF